MMHPIRNVISTMMGAARAPVRSRWWTIEGKRSRAGSRKPRPKLDVSLPSIENSASVSAPAKVSVRPIVSGASSMETRARAGGGGADVGPSASKIGALRSAMPISTGARPAAVAASRSVAIAQAPNVSRRSTPVRSMTMRRACGSARAARLSMRRACPAVQSPESRSTAPSPKDVWLMRGSSAMSAPCAREHQIKAVHFNARRLDRDVLLIARETDCDVGGKSLAVDLALDDSRRETAAQVASRIARRLGPVADDLAAAEAQVRGQRELRAVAVAAQALTQPLGR